MSKHQRAIDILNASGVNAELKVDLYELYLEEVEDTSVESAIEKLNQDIRDLKG